MSRGPRWPPAFVVPSQVHQGSFLVPSDQLKPVSQVAHLPTSHSDVKSCDTADKRSYLSNANAKSIQLSPWIKIGNAQAEQPASPSADICIRTPPGICAERMSSLTPPPRILLVVQWTINNSCCGQDTRPPHTHHPGPHGRPSGGLPGPPHLLTHLVFQPDPAHRYRQVRHHHQNVIIGSPDYAPGTQVGLQTLLPP